MCGSTRGNQRMRTLASSARIGKDLPTTSLVGELSVYPQASMLAGGAHAWSIDPEDERVLTAVHCR